MTYGVVRTFQVIVNTLESSPEKAGVGGSIPSLATTSKELSGEFPNLRFRRSLLVRDENAFGKHHVNAYIPIYKLSDGHIADNAG